MSSSALSCSVLSSADRRHLYLLQMSSFNLRHLVIALQRQLKMKSQQLQEAQAELQVSSGWLQTSSGMNFCVCSSQLQPSATRYCAACVQPDQACTCLRGSWFHSLVM